VRPLLEANRQAAVYADPESAPVLSGPNTDVVTLVEGAEHRVGAATMTPVGRLHAVNHGGVPRCTNVGVVLRAEGEPSLYHPGDAYDGVPGTVDLLAMPINAPWAKVSESIEMVRRVAPRGIIPIHDALLSPAGRRLYLDHITRFGGEELTLYDLAAAGPTSITVA
jgi:L-ascorbate metabolism protein UlaG (beta-lactamase superfamily)